MTKPTNPNLSIPSGFAESGDKTQFSDEYLESGFDPIDPDVLAGDNLNKLIDDTYKGLNYSIEGVQDLYREGIALYDETETYPENAIVKSVEDGSISLYQSLIDSNSGNDLNDETSWQQIGLGGSEIEELMTKVADLSEEVETLLDIDLSNISETGKEYISPISLPSGTYTELTLGSSGDTYTAPADGWVDFGKAAGVSGACYINMKNVTKGYYIECRQYGSSSGTPAGILPVSAGDEYMIRYTNSGSTDIFRFYYAHGAV